MRGKSQRKKGSGFLESRPRKKKEGGAWEWAMTVDSGSLAIGARIEKDGLESKGWEKNRRKMSSILRGGIRIPPQEEERRRSLGVGDDSG